MGEKNKIGFVKFNGVTSEIFKFYPGYLINEKDDEDKFIQIKINGGDYIRIGHLYHRRILRETLKEFEINYQTRFNKMGQEMPLFKGEDYEMIGAGKIVFLNNKLKFYDLSVDYFQDVKGANKNNLESIFGKEKIVEEKEHNLPSFLIDISGISFE